MIIIVFGNSKFTANVINKLKNIEKNVYFFNYMNKI